MKMIYKVVNAKGDMLWHKLENGVYVKMSAPDGKKQSAFWLLFVGMSDALKASIRHVGADYLRKPILDYQWKPAPTAAPALPWVSAEPLILNIHWPLSDSLDSPTATAPWPL